MRRINSVNVEVTNMSEDQERKVVEAADLMLIFFSSNFFYNKLHDIDFSLLRGASESCVSKKLFYNPSAIYCLFMTGQEEWNGVVDYEIDIKLSRYAKFWSKVKGYIIPFKPTIHVNGKFFDNATPLEVGSNAAHEWSHTLGFRHSGYWLRESLPYLINDWWKEYFAITPTVHIDTKDYEKVCKRIWWTFWIKKSCKRIVKEINNG